MNCQEIRIVRRRWTGEFGRVGERDDEQTQIRIIAVPGLERNCHDIEVEGEFGRLAIHIENIPTENPRTGKLTVMSIIRTLQGIIDPLQVGT